MSERTLVVLPTFNEAQTLPEVLRRLRVAVPHADILVVDDSSPDSTGLLADAAALADPAVHVLHRAAKEGLGPAYLAGFGWALRRDYDLIVQSDADGSHRPEDLPSLIGATRSADLVIGSRWVEGGSAPGWQMRRLLLSRAGSRYAGWMLGLSQRDVTGGYRVFRARLLEQVVAEGIASHGYCFQIEMLAHTVALGARVVETPITFDVRAGGRSKMSGRIVIEALCQVTAWGIRRRLVVASSRSRAPVVGSHGRAHA